MRYIDRKDIKDTDRCDVYVLVNERFKWIFSRYGFDAADKALHAHISMLNDRGRRGYAFQIRCNGRVARELCN